MKRYVIFILIAMCVLASCETPIAQIPGEYDEVILIFPPEYSNVDYAWAFVSVFVEYTEDRSPHKQIPKETISIAKGDCEDFALLLSHFGWLYNDPVSVVVGYKEDRPNTLHAACRYKGQIIEPQKYHSILKNFKVVREYSYKEAFYSDHLY